MGKRLAAWMICLILCCLCVSGLAVHAEDLPDMTALETAAPVNDGLPARSAILIEQESGRVLFEKNPDEQLPPASITKVMTLLLTMEAIDQGKLTLNDMITCSAHAASMV